MARVSFCAHTIRRAITNSVRDPTCDCIWRCETQHRCKYLDSIDDWDCYNEEYNVEPFLNVAQWEPVDCFFDLTEEEDKGSTAVLLSTNLEIERTSFCGEPVLYRAVPPYVGY